MKIFVFFLFSTFLINFTLSKRFKNKTHLNKNHTKKNNTHRTFLIRTELNITEIEKLLNNNKTLDINKTIVSEIDDDYENFTLPDEIDIEIEEKSFFECEMNRAKMNDVRDSILAEMDLKSDKLQIYPICEDCLSKSEIIGRGGIDKPQTFMIL